MTDYEKLEFNLILDELARHTSSAPVKEEISKITPSTDLDAVNKLLTQTSDAITVITARRPSMTFDDIMPAIDKVKVGGALSPAELLKVKECILALRSLKACVEERDDCDSLKDITAYARPCDELEMLIAKTVENDLEIKDGASEKLFNIRRAILRANAKLREKLDSFTRHGEYSKFLQDNIVTVRGGRYVLPVRSECRASVKGLVHDVSATGATVFIEPFAVVDANNEIITLKNEEQNEIERILAELSRHVHADAYNLIKGQEVLTECGVIFAKAEYAIKTDSNRPDINNNGMIMLFGARHPLIAIETVVPVDISLDDKKILLISGPNTGGKTVALKTVGLFSLMTACGMFIPVEKNSKIGIFRNIYCDIGDAQSITQSLSTFSAHIVNLSRIMNEMDGSSLVLLDEVGDGTDPEEGAAIAIAIIKKLVGVGATAVVTTHFNSVKEFAISCKSVANSCMQFDSKNFRPTYKLLNGVSGSSYALEIAERLGLSADIISDARQALSAEKVAFDTVMREAEKMRNEVLAQKENIMRLNAEAQINTQATLKARNEYENKLADINEKSAKLIKQRADEYSERAESIIQELKIYVETADQAALFAARKAAKQLQDGVPVSYVKPTDSKNKPLTAELNIGTRVYISGLGKDGVIASKPRGNKVTVAIGSIKTEVPVSSLTIVQDDIVTHRTQHVKITADPENREVMLLGKTVDEATKELDRIIADIPPHSTLRIVHGKGTGALGKGIQAFLKHQPRIKSFRYGRYGEGDTGVTIAEIK